MKNIRCKKNIIVFVLLVFVLVSCVPKTSHNNLKSGKIKLAVSILPLKDLVEKIAGDKVEVVVAIPKGASPANYEPTPREIKDLVDSELYFSIGVPTEKGNILPKLEEEGVRIVYLDKIVDEKYPPRMFDAEHENEVDDEHENEHEHEHAHTGRDPHIWTSPKRAKYMLGAIAEALSEIMPEEKGVFMKNYEEYFEELSALDKDLEEAFKDKGFSFIVFHPSLGYFADDYGLKMISIEKDGKKASANHLKDVIDLGRKNDIKMILYQHEFYSQSAEQIASELGAKAVGYTVLWEDYLEGIKELKTVLLD